MHNRPAYTEIVGFDIPDGRYRIGQVLGETSFILTDDNGDFHSVELGSPGTSKLPGRIAWLCKERTAQGCA